MKVSLVSLFLLATIQLTAQVTQRNILSTRYTLANIQGSLIPATAYHPFPTSLQSGKRQLLKKFWCNW
jgi:hypothetical protein